MSADEEQKYTLKEARQELNRRECYDTEHVWVSLWTFNGSALWRGNRVLAGIGCSRCNITVNVQATEGDAR